MRWYLEEYLDLPDGGSTVRARRIARTLGGWGRGLHDALFADAKAGRRRVRGLTPAGRQDAGAPSEIAASPRQMTHRA